MCIKVVFTLVSFKCWCLRGNSKEGKTCKLQSMIPICFWSNLHPNYCFNKFYRAEISSSVKIKVQTSRNCIYGKLDPLLFMTCHGSRMGMAQSDLGIFKALQILPSWWYNRGLSCVAVAANTLQTRHNESHVTQKTVLKKYQKHWQGTTRVTAVTFVANIVTKSTCLKLSRRIDGWADGQTDGLPKGNPISPFRNSL